jgi:hypothetical protein
MASLLVALAAAALVSSADSAPAAAPDGDTTGAGTPHRISLAIGGGAALNDVDLDGHGSSGGTAMGLRLGYDHALNRWFDLGAGFAYLHVDARAQHAFMPSVRVRAHVGNEHVEAGLSAKLVGLVGLMTNAPQYAGYTATTNTWTGVAGAAAIDLRFWAGDTAFELSPEITVGTAKGDVHGWYLSRELLHMSAIVWVGALRRF